MGGASPLSPLFPPPSWVVAAAANPGCVALSQAQGLARCACRRLQAPWRQYFHHVCLSRPSTAPTDTSPPPSCLQTQGAPHFQTMGNLQAEPHGQGVARARSLLPGHLLIREEFAGRAGPGQLVCCVLSCNGDAAGWHGLGPSHWAAVSGGSKSSALLEQRGIQDADPAGDEKAMSPQTPCPPTPLRGVWLKLSSDLETQWLGGWGAGGRHPACIASATWGQIWGRG